MDLTIKKKRAYPVAPAKRSDWKEVRKINWEPREVALLELLREGDNEPILVQLIDARSPASISSLMDIIGAKFSKANIMLRIMACREDRGRGKRLNLMWPDVRIQLFRVEMR